MLFTQGNASVSPCSASCLRRRPSQAVPRHFPPPVRNTPQVIILWSQGTCAAEQGELVEVRDKKGHVQQAADVTLTKGSMLMVWFCRCGARRKGAPSRRRGQVVLVQTSQCTCAPTMAAEQRRRRRAKAAACSGRSAPSCGRWRGRLALPLAMSRALQGSYAYR